MRARFASLALILTPLACGGNTAASAFAGNWSCENDVEGGLPAHWTLSFVAYANGTLSPAPTAMVDSGEACTAKAYIFTVSGSVAKSQSVTCTDPTFGGQVNTESETLILNGGQLAFEDIGTNIGPMVGDQKISLVGTCTRD